MPRWRSRCIYQPLALPSGRRFGAAVTSPTHEHFTQVYRRPVAGLHKIMAGRHPADDCTGAKNEGHYEPQNVPKRASE